MTFFLAARRLSALILLACSVSVAAQNATPESVIEYGYDAAGNMVAIDVYGTLELFGFSPAAGPPGSTVTLTGSGFANVPSDNRVSIGGAVATVSTASRSGLTIVVPEDAATGVIEVAANGALAHYAGTFEVVSGYGPPSISGFSPVIGSAGSVVSVSGSDFFPGVNETHASIGIATAAITTLTSAELSVQVPTGTGSGRVQVSTPRGSATGPGYFFIPPAPHTASSVELAGALTTGQPQDVVIASAGKIALLAFEVSSPTVLGVRASQSSMTSGAIKLFDPTGIEVASAWISAAGAEIHGTDITQPGTYTVAVIPATGVTGNLSLVVGAADLRMSDASAAAVIANADGSFTLPVTYTVTNVGAVAAKPTWYDFGYLSKTGALDTASISLGNPNVRSTELAPGASYTVTRSFTTATNVAAGEYTLFVKADGHAPSYTGGTVVDAGNVREADEVNNSQALAVELKQPDLRISDVSVAAVIANQDGSFWVPVTYTVTNLGGVAAKPTWYDFGYLSKTGALDTASISLGNPNVRSTELAPGASYTVTRSFTTATNVAAGEYTLFVKADGHSPSYNGGTVVDAGSVKEADELNNVHSLTVELQRPDLKITAAVLATVVSNPNGSFTIPVTYTVKNIGGSAARPFWFDLAFLSSNDILDNGSSPLAGQGIGGSELAVGASYTATTQFSTTTTTNPGNYTLFIKTDGHSPMFTGGVATDTGNLQEADEQNNSRLLMANLQRPDLIVTALSVAAATVNANGSFTMPVTYAVTNAGNAAAQPFWFDLAYLSTNGVLDNDSVALDGQGISASALAPGASYRVTTQFTTSTAIKAGEYTLFVKADGHSPGLTGGTPTDRGNLTEQDDANNAAAVSIAFSR